MANIFIKNGLVLTFDKGTLQGTIIPGGAVAIDGNRIADIGETKALEAKHRGSKKIINAAGKVVMPGFVITHTHMPYVLGHNMPVDFSQLKSFWDMLQKMGWEWLEDITTHDGIYAATRYAAMKMLKSGTTTVCELIEGPDSIPGALESSAKAIEEVGIRAQVGFEVTERIPGVSILDRMDRANAEKGFSENLSFLSKYPKGNGSRIEGRLGVHTAYTNSPETLKKARRIADEHKCGIEIHTAEIPRQFLVDKYGKSAPQLLEEVGLLGPDVIAAHCIDLDDTDLEILSRNGVNIAHTPMSNSLGGNGVARVPDMLEKRMNVTLGHDCFFTLDTSEYLRYAYLIHKAHRANPMLLPPFQTLDMVLGNGARAMGLQKEIGSLQKGKKADILVLDPDSPTPVTPASVIGWFTMTFKGNDVQHVIVDGQLVVEDRCMTTVDQDEVKKQCLEEAKALWRRNGIEI